MFFLSFLPLLLAGFLFVLFSQFFLKNWMESLHICRTELLSTQKQTGHKLEELMSLNPLASNLRAELKAAHVELAIALASRNFPMAARARAKILRIDRERQVLDRRQKALLLAGNSRMAQGVAKVVQRIRQQSHALQSHLPEFFTFRIHSLRTELQPLAVQPDLPDIAPVYRLKDSFKDQQALHVSWISEFQTKSPEKNKWIFNRHKKQDGCSSSLEANHEKFKEVLTKGKSFSKL